MIDALGRRIEETYKGLHDHEMGTDEGVGYIFEKICKIDDMNRAIELVNLSLDEIESKLVEEVGEKATDFYESMTSLGCLSDQISTFSSTAESISRIILDISSQYEDKLTNLNNINHHQKILERSLRIIMDLVEFLQNHSIIHRLLESHSFSEAFTHINSKSNLLKGDLTRLDAVKPLIIEIKEIHLALLKMQDAKII